ncbi:glycosyl transferase family 90-domain-containing protein [Massariosphaeria phaeospora]|uniref:Glycosyl transferase family 90-domain-containing protein n=1 Tax=Massariosphaeria phaeospora TaxID=100035 RepID=A0A7C8IGW3_9PLEO|nr:glycosyl transferase family 90-domain-containing protein [Massariosphaeria phaeospora]
MLLRRRCGVLDILTYFLISASTVIFLLVCAILYGTQTAHPQLPSIVKEVMPAGRCQCEYSTTFTCDTCLDCAAGQVVLGNNITDTGDRKAGEEWVFSYERDANNYGLHEEQCQAAFPGLYEDIERAQKVRAGKEKVTEQELSSVKLTKGTVRAMIFNGELYVLETLLVDNVNRQKALAALAALHRAIVSAPQHASIPDIEFILNVEDLGATAAPGKPIWVLARRAQDELNWLIPDFGFWSWDVPQVGTLHELAVEAVRREGLEPWEAKLDKLVWRGKITFAPKLRHALLDASRGKSWSNVGTVKYSDLDYKQQFVGPIDQCKYKYTAHVEGRSYSGSLKYRQLCRSVVVSHKLQWIQHYHYLFRANGTHQNYVEVERDFRDLDAAMQDLLAHPEKAKRIADNSVAVFRERYLTQAAEACYWRTLFAAWEKVSHAPRLYEGVGEGEQRSRSQKRGVRYETFMLFESGSQLDYPKSLQQTKPP